MNEEFARICPVLAIYANTSNSLGGGPLLACGNEEQLQKYLKEFEDEEQNKKVNFFVIEEPEAHMHPQMQKEFVRYLLKMYKDKKMQGIVTTHASEVVRIAGISQVRERLV